MGRQLPNIRKDATAEALGSWIPMEPQPGDLLKSSFWHWLACSCMATASRLRDSVGDRKVSFLMGRHLQLLQALQICSWDLLSNTVGWTTGRALAIL